MKVNIQIPKISAKEFSKRRAAIGLTLEQLSALTDIGRQRISRAERGEKASLRYDSKTKKLYVPRGLTMALLYVEQNLQAA